MITFNEYMRKMQEAADGGFPKLDKKGEEALDKQDKERTRNFVAKNKEEWKKKLDSEAERKKKKKHP